jgi:signal transduction histidine kinase
VTRSSGPGLRARLVTALVLTSAVTLAVAAVALLSPLERQLRNDELHSLAEAAQTARPVLAPLSASSLQDGDPTLVALAHKLHMRTGAQIVVLGPRGDVLAASDLDPGDPLTDGREALRRGHLVRGVEGEESEEEAAVAAPLTVDHRRVVLILRRPLAEVHSAVQVVGRAFATAALAGLVVALVLGLVLATRLVRRLRALTATAVAVAEAGPSPDPPTDSSRDEVGTLTRALALMQHRLDVQERARRTFVATASHELRTPLASLQLMLDGLVDDLRSEAPDLCDAEEQGVRALAQTRRLSKLAAELLDLSRIDAGVPLRRELVELRELARSVAAEFAERADEGSPIAQSGSHEAWALADPGAVAQVVRILLDNALRFAPPGSTIRVVVHVDGERAGIEVTDDGPGVPASDREAVFERFWRGEQTGGHGGFGLGLAIGRELARLMGGELRLVPGRPGGCFELVLAPAGRALLDGSQPARSDRAGRQRRAASTVQPASGG